MAFVLDKEGNFLPVYGETSGGGGTTDHAQLTNLSYADSGHTGFMSSANYIPSGTTLTVKADGSGDFETIADAVNHLTGKWSDGEVKIRIAAGTHTVSSNISIDGAKFNIPFITIYGDAKATSIIQFSGAANANAISILNVNASLVSNFTVTRITNTKTGVGFEINNTCLGVNGIEVSNFATGILGTLPSDIQLRADISISDCNIGIQAQRFTKIVTYGSTAVNLTNLTTGWSVLTGGLITTSTTITNVTYTNVTNKCSQTVGTFNSNGFIGGTLQN